MPKLRVHNFTISLDGYAAGPEQSLDHPLGVGGTRLHDWAFPAETPETDTDLDRRFAAEREVGIGATIMGRNMFGPVRGGWGDSDWKGWWGEDPPFGHPVFVLTHHAHPPIPMAGGTTFHFVTDGIEAALEQASGAAGDADVAIGGGASTVQQYLAAGLIDEMHLVIAPILLGGGERLFDHLDGGSHGYECTEQVSSASVTHVRLTRVR
jgi:dihydrofolate reductase